MSGSRTFPTRELALIDGLKRHCNQGAAPAYCVGIGDDAAVRRCRASETLVFTADVLVEDVDFSLRYMSLREAGYKAVVANVSDCAAMGARPDGALVQVTFPAGTRRIAAAFEDLYRGIGEACRRWGFAVVGGDISSGPSWVLSVTMIGRCDSGCVLCRAGAREGDGLWVTGSLGESAAGLAAIRRFGRSAAARRHRRLVQRHIRPQARVEAGWALAHSPQVHAAIDISDGLASEAAILAHDSGLGIVLESGACVPPAGVVSLARRIGADPARMYLEGGEDFELLFAAGRRFDPGALRGTGRLDFTRIGWFSAQVKGVVIEGSGGRRQVMMARGWDHLTRGGR